MLSKLFAGFRQPKSGMPLRTPDSAPYALAEWDSSRTLTCHECDAEYQVGHRVALVPGEIHIVAGLTGKDIGIQDLTLELCTVANQGIGSGVQLPQWRIPDLVVPASSHLNGLNQSLLSASRKESASRYWTCPSCDYVNNFPWSPGYALAVYVEEFGFFHAPSGRIYDEGKLSGTRLAIGNYLLSGVGPVFGESCANALKGKLPSWMAVNKVECTALLGPKWQQYLNQRFGKGCWQQVHYEFVDGGSGMHQIVAKLR